MQRAGCEQQFIDVANKILGATRNAKGLGVNTAREEGVQPLREGRKAKRKGNKKFLLYRRFLERARFFITCRIFQIGTPPDKIFSFLVGKLDAVPRFQEIPRFVS